MNSKKLFLVGLGGREDLLDSTGPLSKGSESGHKVAVTDLTLLDVIG